jgi:hypothetical protein
VVSGLPPVQQVQARESLLRVIATVEVDSIRRRAQRALEQADEHAGFITDWRVAGPFMEEGRNGLDLLDLSFPPEQPDATGVEWRSQPMSDDPNTFWFVNLNRPVGGPHRVSYLRSGIHSSAEQPVLLELGSDDGVKVWLNGEVIHRFSGIRGCSRSADKIEAVLKAGWNDLLLKVANNSGGWGACVQLRRPDGSVLEGVKIKRIRSAKP